MFQVYDSRGRRVVLGREIGRGGEGAVYEIGDTPDLLAKVYEKEVSSEKAAKLAAMARMINPALLAISAWPTDILYDRSGGQLRGFVMPRIAGHHEIHVLYSPAQRKLEFPKADRKFLVHVARNLAAAIETVHAQGYVIGDVNQKRILILPQQATVKLIDCDSFQILTNGRRFLISL
jgi:DNA-binding helix-hairpin-helix protein with protein kinase domain